MEIEPRSVPIGVLGQAAGRQVLVGEAGLAELAGELLGRVQRAAAGRIPEYRRPEAGQPARVLAVEGDVPDPHEFSSASLPPRP